MKKLLPIITLLLLPFFASAFAPRTIVNPATNSPITSAIMRNELQILENEIAGVSNTATGASSTVLTDNNTFSGINSFTNALSNFAGTWQNLSPSHFQVAGSGTSGNCVQWGAGNTQTDAGAPCGSGGGGGAAYPFSLTGNATSTLTQFNAGLTAYSSSTVSSLTVTNGTTTNATSTNIAVTTLCLIGDTCRTTWPTGGGGSSFGEAWQLFNSKAYLAPTTTVGIIVSASSTIGAGTQATGLTINGGATTTGTAYFAGNVGIGTVNPGASLDVGGNGSININQYGGYKQAGNTILYASSTMQDIFVGQYAGNTFDTGGKNSALGYQALNTINNGANNVAIGNSALYYNTAGSGNVALGFGAGLRETGSNDFYINNVFESSLANDKAYSLLYGTFSGTAGSLVGQGLTINGNATTTGNATSTNFFATTASSTNLFTANFNGAGLSACTGSNVLQWTGGSFSCAASPGAGFGQTVEIDSSNWISSTSTVYGGLNAKALGTTYGFGIGDALLGYASSTNFSTVFGLGAGNSATTSNSSSLDLSAFGYKALNANTGNDNSAFGEYSLANNTTGARNTAIGSAALGGNTTGIDNVGIGYATGNTNDIGSYNTWIGQGSGAQNGVGYNRTGQTAVGASAISKAGGDYNTGFGFNAGSSLDSFGPGNYGNILIGPSVAASNLTSGHGNIGLGYNIFFPTASQSNLLNIGGLIFGSLPATSTAWTVPNAGAVGISTSTPWAKLSIALNGGDTYGTAFAIGSSTAAYATTTLFSIDNTGAISAASNNFVINKTGTVTTGVWNGTAIAIANGGTGQTTAATAFNALSPLTTSGDLLYGGASGAGTRLALGTSGYVLASLNGIPTWVATSTIVNTGAYKDAADYATITALPANTYSANVLTEVGTGALSIDSGSPSIGQRILVKNEATQTHNGIYDVTAAGSGIAAYVLTRSSDFNVSADIYPGVGVYVRLGTTLANTQWSVTTAPTIVLDTSNITWAESANGNITLPISVANGGTGVVTLTGCLTGNGTGAITGSGTCNTSAASVTSVGLSSSGSLTIASTPVTTSGTITANLNLNNSNTWASQQFFNGLTGFGTSTPWAQLSIATTTSQNTVPLFAVGSSTVSNIPFQINGFGKVISTDQVSTYVGVDSPLHNLAVQMATTTAWTGTSTAPYSATIVMPFAGTLRDARCKTDVGTLEVQTKINSTILTYMAITSTQALASFSSSNTFVAGDVLTVNAGNPATAPTILSCTYRATESP